MAAGHIDLPGAQNLPSQTWTQDSVTVDGQEIVICDASGNIVGVTSNCLDVNVGAALPAGTNNIGDVDVLTLPDVKLGQATATTGAITGALQVAASMSVVGYSTVTLMVSGTYAGVSVVIQGSNDGGTTRFTIPMRDMQTGVAKLTAGLGTNQTRLFQADVAGLTEVSVGSGTYTSGTANVRLVASAAPTAGTASAGLPVAEGRTALSYYAVAVAAGTTTTETAITLTKSIGTAATAANATQVPTAGKRFRITHLSVATRGHNTATAQTTTFNFRINTGGAVTTSSTPIVFAARCATTLANEWLRYQLPIPDGYEIAGDGTLNFGITAAATYTTNAPTWDVNLIGYEF